MRFASRWLSGAMALMLTASWTWALPVPVLPPEATDKPSVVIRVKAMEELLKDAAYIAKLVGQEDIFNAVEPGLAPVLEALDVKKPFGFYAKIRSQGIDSTGILMIPAKGEKEFVAVLNQLLGQIGVTPQEGKDGLWSIDVPGSPFPVLFRFANGYIYATAKNTADAEPMLEKNKLYAPDALFQAGDDSLFSVTFNADAIPNELKKKVLEGLEFGLREFQNNELPKQADVVVRHFMKTASEEVALRIQGLIVNTKTVAVRFDLNRDKEEMAVSTKLTARPGTDLADDIATLGGKQGLGAGLIAASSTMNMATSVSVPGSMKKQFGTMIDEILKKVGADAPAKIKAIVDAFGPTLRAGILDMGFDITPPGAAGHCAIVSGMRLEKGEDLEAALRKVVGELSENQKGQIKIDVEKVGGVGIHQITPKGTDFDENTRKLVGDQPEVFVAVRKDLVIVAVGPEAQARAAIKAAASASAKDSKVFQGEIAMRNLAVVIEPKEPGAKDAAKKAYPASVSDAVRFTISGGSSMDLRFTASSRLIQFSMLMQQAHRNR